MTKTGRRRGLLAAALASLTLLPVLARAQITTNLTEVTRTWNATTGSYDYDTWKPVLGVPGAGQTGSDGYLYDPVSDSQTGLLHADFVSSAGSPGFFIKTFAVAGVDYLAFRIVLDALPTNSNFYIRMGLDADLNGSVDLFFGPTFSGSTLQDISFVAPGSGLNISPNTTTVDPTPVLTITPANAYFASATLASNGALYPGWTQQNSTVDGVMSFAVPVSSINQALGLVGSSATIAADSLLRWVAFTANQQNSVNQDAYGLGNTKDKTTAGITYASFSQIMDSAGNPIPEPSAYGLFFGAGLVGFLSLRRRSRVHRAA